MKIKGQISKELEVHPSEGEVRIWTWSAKDNTAGLVQHEGKWKLPVQFAISGVFETDEWGLQSLEGLPHVMLGHLKLTKVDIEDCTGLPKHVASKSDNGGINYDIEISSISPLKNLVGMPHVVSLGIRSPLLSIEGIPSSLEYLTLNTYSDVQSILKACPKLQMISIMDFNAKTGRPLLVFRSKNIKRVWFSNTDLDADGTSQVNKIFNKHLGTPERDIFLCQEELVEAGFKDFAR